MWSPLQVADSLVVVGVQTGASQSSHPPARAKLCPPSCPAWLQSALAGSGLPVLSPALTLSNLPPAHPAPACSMVHALTSAALLQPLALPECPSCKPDWGSGLRQTWDQVRAWPLAGRVTLPEPQFPLLEKEYQ